MLTGRLAFAGEDVANTLAFIITKEPDWSVLPANTPAPIRKLLRRCLEKDRKRRVADSADVRLEIEEAVTQPGDAVIAPQPVPMPRRRMWADRSAGLIAGSIVTAMAAAAIVYASRPSAPAVTRFLIRRPKPPSSSRVDAQVRAPTFLRTERGSHLRREIGRARFSCGCARWIR